MGISLKYKEHNLEINELFLIFSRVINSLRYARNEFDSSNLNSLINYHEVYKTFKNLNNTAKVEACINNMSAICSKKNLFYISFGSI